MSEVLDSIKPLADRILIRKNEPPEKTAGGLYIPRSAEDRELAWRSTVVAVGPGKFLENGERSEPKVKQGETVLVGKYTGTQITLNGIEYFVVREDDVLAVLDPD